MDVIFTLETQMGKLVLNEGQCFIFIIYGYIVVWNDFFNKWDKLWSQYYWLLKWYQLNSIIRGSHIKGVNPWLMPRMKNIRLETLPLFPSLIYILLNTSLVEAKEMELWERSSVKCLKNSHNEFILYEG